MLNVPSASVVPLPRFVSSTSIARWRERGKEEGGGGEGGSHP